MSNDEDYQLNSTPLKHFLLLLGIPRYNNCVNVLFLYKRFDMSHNHKQESRQNVRILKHI